MTKKQWLDIFIKYERGFIAGSLFFILSSCFYFLDHRSFLLFSENPLPNILISRVDHFFPFQPKWIWVYLLYFPFCFLPLLLIRRIENFRKVAFAYGLQFMIGFGFFYFYPIKMMRPDISVDSIHSRIIYYLYKIDPGFNIFPSLHVSNSFLVALTFNHYKGRNWGITFFSIALLISLSTLYIKQHYFADLISGFVLALITYYCIFLRNWNPVLKKIKQFFWRKNESF